MWLLLGAAVAVAIRIGDWGPVLYRQERLGRGFHLDELPQAINVLKGEMSLVGPRPERPALAASFEREAPGFSRRLRVRPGVMGLAQALGSYHWSPRYKLAYDNLYIDAMHPRLDAEIAVRCVRKVLRAAGRRTAPEGVAPPVPALPGYDYLLAAGPGRSGSTFLYRLLNGHALRSRRSRTRTTTARRAASSRPCGVCTTRDAPWAGAGALLGEVRGLRKMNYVNGKMSFVIQGYIQMTKLSL